MFEEKIPYDYRYEEWFLMRLKKKRYKQRETEMLALHFLFSMDHEATKSLEPTQTMSKEEVEALSKITRPIKYGETLSMGTPTIPLAEEARKLGETNFYVQLPRFIIVKFSPFQTKNVVEIKKAIMGSIRESSEFKYIPIILTVLTGRGVSDLIAESDKTIVDALNELRGEVGLEPLS